MPVAQIAVGVGTAILGGIFGGQKQASSNRQQKKAIEQQYKQDVQMWEYTNEQNERRYEHNLEGVGIQRYNYANRIALQEQASADSWSYNMTVRDFDYATQVKLRNQQIRQSNQQLGLNATAYNNALNQTYDYEIEQAMQLGMQFRDAQQQFQQGRADTQLNQLQNETGFVQSIQRNNLKINQAQKNYEQNQAASMLKQEGNTQRNTLNKNLSAIEGLEAEGEAIAKGASGRSGSKLVQGTAAKSGAKQSQFDQATRQGRDSMLLETVANMQAFMNVRADAALSSTEASNQFNLSSKQNVLNLRKLNDNLRTAKMGYGLSQSSLSKRTSSMRKEILQQRMQTLDASKRHCACGERYTLGL